MEVLEMLKHIHNFSGYRIIHCALRLAGYSQFDFSIFIGHDSSFIACLADRSVQGRRKQNFKIWRSQSSRFTATTGAQIQFARDVWELVVDCSLLSST